MGASMVKWIAPNRCLMLSESVSKLYTNLNLVVKKNHRHFRKHIDLQGQAIYDDKNNSKKSLHILTDDASGVQVGDVEQAIV